MPVELEVLELSCHCHCRVLTLSCATCCARSRWASAAEGGALETDGRRPPRTSSPVLAFVRASGSAVAEWYARPTPSVAFGAQRTRSAFGAESWRSDAQAGGAQATVEMAHEALGQAHWAASRLVRLVSGAWHWGPDQPSEHTHADSTHTP